jgi:acyl-CoA thioester hydrolase
LPPSNYFMSETSLRIRYAEVDAMGIVHHSHYIVFLEEGRSDHARKRGHPYGKIEKEGIYLLVTEISIRHHNPAHYEDLIVVRTWVADIQSRGMTFNYEIVNADSGELLVTAATKHVCITPDGKIARIPAAWREWAKKPDQLIENHA